MRSYSVPAARTRILIFAVLLAAALAVTATIQPSAAAAHRYDREDLIRLTDRYLAALVAHDPGQAPLADGVRTVENITAIQPGEGLWASATGGPTAFAIHVPDPYRQAAGFIGVMERDSAPILVALRLKYERGEIVEAEHLIAGDLAEANLANLETPRPGLRAQIPRGQRLPHHKLITTGASYYDALDDNDGDLAPFGADCERHENGFVTAGPDLPPPDPSTGIPAVASDCAEQLDSQVFTYIDTIDNRRVFAADRVTGLVMGLSHFRHSMATGPYEVILADGSVITYQPDFDPFDLPAAHIFKVGADRQLHEIEAMGFTAPYDSPTGWE
jgi:hypothetical protein